MPTEILMPALSPTMTEGILAKWCKAEGDEIKAGDVITEIETDKATMEVEAPEDGVLGKIIVPDGTKGVKINSVIAMLLVDGEDASALKDMDVQTATTQQSDEAKVSDSSCEEKKTVCASKNEEVKVDSSAKSCSSVSHKVNDEIKRIFASPLAKRIASQNNIELSVIEGTGPRGRIVKSDVLLAVDTGSKKHSCKGKCSNVARQAPSKITISGFRQSIADKLSEVKRNIPHFYLSVEVNVDKLLSMRADINEDNKEKQAAKISVNDLIVKATALAFRDIPEANASWQGTHIDQYHNVDAAVAVSVDGGIFTPIVKDADKKSVFEVSKEIKELVARAKAGELKPNEFLGGSFTISNLGMYNIDRFAAILNPPQSCIFAVGKAKKIPVVEGDKIIISNVMNITVSCDHRVVDGAVCAIVVNKVKSYLENPFKLLI
ncbi:MAG: pyruvate dehydrogenase complex dihydrolipoamide acetyltransferase [Rickettsiales bacterium]|nr:pyruvate dehydrogenase complex dihydrolipoamide acetyltransferase [Rickettsiales bacterium]